MTYLSSSRAIWINGGSFKLARYEKLVLRHPHAAPRTWRDDEKLVLRAVRTIFPDAVKTRYKGGVLGFHWNDGEGSGEAFEAAATPGEITFS